MIEIQVFALKNMTTILTSVTIPFKNIVARKLDLFLWETIKKQKNYHPGNAYLERDGMNTFRMRLVLRKVMPFFEIERLK